MKNNQLRIERDKKRQGTQEALSRLVYEARKQGELNQVLALMSRGEIKQAVKRIV